MNLIEKIKEVLNKYTSTSRTADAFKVSFVGMNGNIDLNDHLGYMVKSVSNIELSFSANTTPSRHRAQTQHVGRTETIAPITFEIHNDAGGISFAVIMTQIMIQQGKYADIRTEVSGDPAFDPYFGVEIQYLDDSGESVEDLKFAGCYISNVTLPNYRTDDKEATENITITVQPSSFKTDYVSSFHSVI